MDIFGKYSSYYNLLYSDKDYAGEAKYIDQIIKQFSPQAKSIMDLGCGTGKHAHLLAEMGYQVLGVDQSADMLCVAKKTVTNNNPAFICSDIRCGNLGMKVDVVTALFHVLSYQTSNDALAGVLKFVTEHLSAGGIFIFDFWYGPAVLNLYPEPRLKELDNENIQVYRFALPEVRPNDNVVDVQYKILVRNKIDGVSEELSELHSMRYFFLPELKYFLAQNGLEIEYTSEWMTNQAPGDSTWGVVAVTRWKK